MPRKQKATADEKIKIVEACLAGKIGQSEASKHLQVNKEAIREWISRYKAEGVEAFLHTERNRSYSPELKTQAVLSYINGEGSLLEVCQKYSIRSKTQLIAWLKVYNTHGDFNSVKHSGGGSYMRKARETTWEERIEIAKECLVSGRNYGASAKKHNVSYQQARTWTLRYEKLGEAGLEDRRGRRKKDQTPRTELEKAQIEIEKLKHQLYMAEMERDLLKKLNELERGDLLGR